MKPKISIITVNYNNLVGLKKTFKSVRNQTYQDFEYIVIDGGSTDGSASFLETNNTLFNYWVSEPDHGIYHAMNKGIEIATGEYLLFLNSGDHFFNNKVLELNQHLIIIYDLIYFNMNVVGKDKRFVKEYPDTLSFAYFLKDNLPHPAIFIKKNLFEIVGLFKEDFKIVADWKFFIDSVCLHSASYLHVNSTLTTFYLDGISSSRESIGVINGEKDKVLKNKYLPFMHDLDNVLKYMTIIHSLRRSRKIKWLIRLGFLNKF